MAGPESKAVWKKHQEHLWPSVRAYYDEPLALVEGDGLVVKDADGNEYLDFFGGILTVSVGHRNPTVNRAITDQVDRILHTSTLYPSLPMVELAEALARLAPGDLETAFFTPSGTDADETAVMLAQIFTGQQEIIALRHCYSGRSFMARAMTAHAPWRMVSTQLSFFKHAHAPYCYRCDLGLEYPSCEMRCARDIESLIQTTTVGKIAGFIAEPIQGVGGFVTPPKEYFEVATGIIKNYGGLFICDEVQTGFARTGGKMWGIQHYGVQPDIMTMAKGIANGLPLGAAITRPQIAERMTGMTISTFGGNPVSCAAAVATLKVIEGEGLLQRVETLGKRFKDGLESLQRDFPKVIGDVRGKGLMLALELVVDETAGDRTPNVGATAAFFEASRRRGLLVGKGGLYGNVLRIAPPMTVDEGQIDDALEILAESFREITA
jgi:4-aminobutyrate aminotransferase-like enzyme